VQRRTQFFDHEVVDQSTIATKCLGTHAGTTMTKVLTSEGGNQSLGGAGIEGP
jgi:hypothetical protein